MVSQGRVGAQGSTAAPPPWQIEGVSPQPSTLLKSRLPLRQPLRLHAVGAIGAIGQRAELGGFGEEDAPLHVRVDDELAGRPPSAFLRELELLMDVVHGQLWGDVPHGSRGESAQQRRLALAIAADEAVHAATHERKRGVLKQVTPTARIRKRERLRLDRSRVCAFCTPQSDGVGDSRLERSLLRGALLHNALVLGLRSATLRLLLRLALLPRVQRLVDVHKTPTEPRVVGLAEELVVRIRHGGRFAQKLERRVANVHGFHIRLELSQCCKQLRALCQRSVVIGTALAAHEELHDSVTHLVLILVAFQHVDDVVHDILVQPIQQPAARGPRVLWHRDRGSVLRDTVRW